MRVESQAESTLCKTVQLIAHMVKINVGAMHVPYRYIQVTYKPVTIAMLAMCCAMLPMNDGFS